MLNVPQSYVDGRPTRALANGQDCRLIRITEDVCRFQPFLGGIWRFGRIVHHGWSTVGWSVVLEPCEKPAGPGDVDGSAIAADAIARAVGG